MLLRTNLRTYQRRAVDFIKRHRRAGLFLDMGLGKTISTLTAISDLLSGGTVRRVLVIGPKRPVEAVWRQEARKWAHTKHLTFKLIAGDERKRLLSLNSQAQVHLISVDNFRWLCQVLKTRAKRHGWPYDMLVVDESSMFKTPSSKRFVSMRNYVKRFDRRVILTGTPAPKSLMDLWSQVFILDEGMRLGSNVDRFRSRFFNPAGFKGYGYEPDEGAEQAILELISPLILTMRGEDWLDLPPTIKENIYVDLPPQKLSLYRKLEEEMFLELEMGDAEAINEAALSAKCWQFANGFLYVEDSAGERAWQAMHDAKLEALREIVDGTGNNILVAYWFKPDLARLKKAYPRAPAVADAKNDRALDKLQNDWNAGKHPIMFVHPQGGGHGLNFQEGGNTIVFFSMLWGREPYAQVIERIGAARQVNVGRDRVLVKHIIARDTVDEAMLMRQQERHRNERRALKILKEYRERKELLA